LKCGNRTKFGLGGAAKPESGPNYPPLIGVDPRPSAGSKRTWLKKELGRNRNWGHWVALKNEVGTMSDIGERVKKIVVEHLGVEPDKVTENASFIDDLGADSLDTVELVMAFEEEFGCEIPDDAAETILTVGDAVKFLEKNAKS
jgi:acyl carrier protein